MPEGTDGPFRSLGEWLEAFKDRYGGAEHDSPVTKGIDFLGGLFGGGEAPANLDSDQSIVNAALAAAGINIASAPANVIQEIMTSVAQARAQGYSPQQIVNGAIQVAQGMVQSGFPGITTVQTPSGGAGGENNVATQLPDGSQGELVGFADDGQPVLTDSFGNWWVGGQKADMSNPTHAQLVQQATTNGTRGGTGTGSATAGAQNRLLGAQASLLEQQLSGQPVLFGDFLAGQDQAFQQGPAFEEMIRQFQETLGADADQANIARDLGLLDASIDQAGTLGRLQLDADALKNQQFQFGAQFGEGQRQFDINTIEGQRQFDTALTERAAMDRAAEERQRASLQEMARQFGISESRLLQDSAVNASTRLQEANLNNQRFVAEILRSPADYLARAFFQRGGESPVPEITQADLLNTLQGEINRIGELTSGMAPGSAIDPTAGQFTADQLAAIEPFLLEAGIDPRTLRQSLGDAPSISSTPGAGEIQSFFDQFMDQITKASGPGVTPTYTTPSLYPGSGPSPQPPAGDPNSGTSGPAAPPSGGAAVPPSGGTTTQYPGGGFYPSVDDPSDSIASPFQPPLLQAPADTNVTGGLTAQDINDFYTRLNPTNPTGEILGELSQATRLGPTAPTLEEQLADPTLKKAYGGLALNQGGVTRQPQFLVGDKPGGRIGPQTEMIINPTNAPISVVPRDRLPNQSRLMQGFNEGTLGTLDEPVNPTQSVPNYTSTQPLEPPARLSTGSLRNHIEPGLSMPTTVSDPAFEQAYAQLDPNINIQDKLRLAREAVTGQQQQQIVALPAAPAPPPAPSENTTVPTSAVNAIAEMLSGFNRPADFTQNQIQDYERAFRPPAVHSILQGQRPSELSLDSRLEGPLATPTQLRDLTQDEGESLRTALASKQISLDDYLQLVQRRFGRTRTAPRGRLLPQ